MDTNTLSPTLSKAMDLLAANDPMKAGALMRDHVQEQERGHGAKSMEFAHAKWEHACYFLRIHQVDDAIDALREAAAVDLGGNELAERNRLTYLMVLGDVLSELGRLQEAEEVLREGLEDRGQFYGTRHSGYAFGLIPLSDLLARRGDYNGALALIDEAMEILWDEGHERVGEAMLKQALLICITDADRVLFTGIDQLPEDILKILVQTAYTVIVPELGDSCNEVLPELARKLEAKLGMGHPLRVQVLAQLANIQRGLGDDGDPALRESAIQSVIAIHDAAGEIRQKILAISGLAVARSENDDIPGAIRAYEEALQESRQFGDGAIISQVTRNFGLYFAELERTKEAEAMLAEAVEQGKEGGDMEMHGRACAALGIFLQHEERFKEARCHLNEACELLPSDHPDCVCAQSHLQALDTDKPCGCGNTAEAMAQTFRAYVLERLPAGILDDIKINIEDTGELRIGIQTSKDLNDDDMKLISETIQFALAEFKVSLGREE